MVAGPTASRAFQAAKPAAGNLPAPVQLTPQDDHQRLMDLLHITEVRRGKDGNNKDSPNYANYDESKANPYPNLPDPLVLKDGKKVTTAAVWWNQRRPEIVEDFDREVYGRVPKNVPKVSWRVVSFARDKNGDVPIITKQIVGHVDNSMDPQITVDIQVTLTTPANAKGPVPVIMVFGGGFGGGAPGAGRGAAGQAPAGPPYGPNAFATPPPRARSGGSASRPRRAGCGGRTCGTRRAGRIRGSRANRTHLAATGSGEGLGLCQLEHRQHSGRQRRGSDARHHRSGQQGAAPQGGRLGRVASLGLGRQPRLGLF